MEIKPQDLRIGNLLHREDGTGVLIDALAIVEASQRQVANGNTGLKGIELTPEWLTMAGFEKLNVSGFVISGATYWRRKGITIYEIEGKYMLPIGENLGDTPGRIVIQFDKLHELQNIFALTGEELAIDKQLSNGN